MNRDLENLAILIKKERKLRGLSQESFSEQSDISLALVSELERGIANPTVSTLSKLAQNFNVPIGQLFSEQKTSETLDNIRVALIREILQLDAETIIKVHAFVEKTKNRDTNIVD